MMRNKRVRARWTTVRWGENKQDVLDAGDALCTQLATLESTNAALLEALETIVDLDSRSSTRAGWNRDIVKAVKIATEAIRKAKGE